MENNFATITAQDGGELFGLMKPIYEQFSKSEVPSVVQGCAGLEEFVGAATAKTGALNCSVEINSNIQFPSNNKVLVAYTGGKDSTAEAIRLLNAGYEVHLLFIKGLNKAYPKELDGAAKIAEILGCKMHTTEVKITGKNWHPDNPVKNQLILALMTDWGIKNGFGKFASGIINVPCANYEYNWSDSLQLMETFKSFIRKRFPGWTYIDTSVTHEAENLVEIIKHKRGEEIWEAKSSCVGAYRFRNVWRQKNEEKFGIKLTENQCGVCYKCAYEYVVRCAFTGNVTSPAYLKKCVGILRGEKAQTYDKTTYTSLIDWTLATFGEQVGNMVLKIL